MSRMDYESFKQFEKCFENIKDEMEYIREEIQELSEKVEAHIGATNDRFTRLKTKLNENLELFHARLEYLRRKV